MAENSGSVKSIYMALAANFIISLAKFAAAIVTKSGSMFAEAIHSLADSGNQGLLLLGLKKAKKPASIDFPLGHGKEIYFWSFLVAIILFSVGGVFSIYEGVHKLQHPEPLSSPLIAIGVLLFSIMLEGAAMWGCWKEVKKDARGRKVWTWFKESRRSELIVVFGEDFAALTGLTFALFAISLTLYTGNPVYDAAGSIVIGALLMVVAIFIGFEVKSLLIGQSVDLDVQKEMEEFLKNRDEIDDIFSLKTLQLGGDVMVAVKAKMAPMDSAEDLIKAINQCEIQLKEKYPQILWSFFEPDLK
ncbi:MAG TPA: cation diffusion facilitator family transporter [Sulfurimonas sp.]|nr:cation diffusion facilitator family transporter [Sulfurimonas sp.]